MTLIAELIEYHPAVVLVSRNYNNNNNNDKLRIIYGLRVSFQYDRRG